MFISKIQLNPTMIQGKHYLTGKLLRASVFINKDCSYIPLSLLNLSTTVSPI